MQTLKNQIKTLAQEQKVLKNQRKTVKFSGDRTIDSWEASMKHRSNRFKLRDLNFAHGIMKGRKPEEIEFNAKEPINMENINKIITEYEEYEKEIVCSNS